MQPSFLLSHLTCAFLICTALPCVADLPANKNIKAAPISSSAAQAIFASTPKSASPPASLAPGSIPEIVELARALKNDPDLIYQYVHDRIQYTPIYGSSKGPFGALLDNEGNDFDQSALMVALLRQAGYTANFVHGLIRISPTQVTNWLGVINDPDTAGYLVGSAGIPATPYINATGALAFLEMEHVWVKAIIGGTNFVFDPSFKSNVYAASADLKTAMGYDRTNFIAGAMVGAISNSLYLQNINVAALRSALTNYTTNLVNFIQTNRPGATLEQIIGGKAIAAAQLPLRQTNLAYQYSILHEWTDIPATYKTSLRIQHLGIDVTLYSEDLFARRLTIFYDGLNRPVLRLDGATLGTGSSTTANTYQDLVLTVDHPYAGGSGTYADDSQTLSLRGGGTNAYYIVNGWSGVNKAVVDRLRRILKENSFGGAAKTSEPVLGASLAVMGATWLAEKTRADVIADHVGRTFTIHHHLLGVCGQNQSPYVDLPMNLVSTVTSDGDVRSESAQFFSSAGHGSAFEWGAVEQNQPFTAVCTVKLLDIANSRSNKIYDATSTNYFSSVRPLLQNYDSYELSYVDAYINAGYRVLVPEDGNLGEGLWSGIGFLAISPAQNQIGHIISGGFKGGYGVVVVMVDGVPVIYDPSSSTHAQSAEPIDLVAGDYLYEHTDLNLGNGPYPFSLEFRRSYTSGARLDDGPLGLGWTHNFDLSASVRSDGFVGMGSDGPISAAAAIVEHVVSTDLLKTNKTEQLVLLATFAHRWFMDQQIGNMVTVRQPGYSVQFTRVPGGSYQPPPGVAATLTLRTNNSFLLRNKTGEVLDFTTNGSIASWRDPNSNTVSFVYSLGRLATVSNEMGKALFFAYTNGRINQVTDNAARSVAYQYDTNGNLLRHIDALNTQTTFEYDQPGRMTRMFYPSHPTQSFTANTYDSLGRVLTQADAQTNVWTYYFAGIRTEEVNPLGQRRVMYFDEHGKTIQESDALTNKTLFEYDGQRRLTKRAAPETNAILYEYDARHNVTKTTVVPKPGSTNAPSVSFFTYESNFNRLLMSVDALNRTNAYVYDGKGNMIRTDGPVVDGAVPQTIFANNSRGQVLQVTDPSGRKKSSVFHPLTGELLSSIVDPGGLNLTTQFDYDTVGNALHTTDPLGRITTIEYDAMRRPKRQIAPAPFSYVTTNTYDADGRLVRIERQTGDVATPWQTITHTYTLSGKKKTDVTALGNTTLYQYDPVDRLSSVTDAENHATQSQYDAAGRLYRVINAQGNIQEEHLYTLNGKQQSIRDAKGNLTQYEYDGFDRLAKIIYPDASYEQFTYDAVGSVLQKRTRSSQIITNTYDNLNRLRTHSLSGVSFQYTYDLAGRMIDATNANGLIHHVYDAAGRVATVTYPGSMTVTNLYDAVGNRTSLTYPDGFFVTYVYDALNRMTNVMSGGTNQLVRYTYDALSQRKRSDLGNGTFASYAYDADGRLTSISNRFSTNGVSFDYTYDRTVNRTSLHVSDDSFFFKPTTNSQNTFSNNALNEYTLVNGVSYTYDGNGNLLTDGINRYAYDAENRLLSVTNLSYALTNTYDALGRRFRKKVNGTMTSYLSHNNRVLMEMSTNGTLLRRYIYGRGLDERVALFTSNATYYYYIDGNNSVIALAGNSGAVAETYRYDPFGKTPQTSTIGNPYLFAGMEYDREATLYYMRARFYHPQLGRFVQVDPALYQAGLNLYAYAAGNPVSYRDPLGLARDNSFLRSLGEFLLVGVGIATLEFGIGELLLVEEGELLLAEETLEEGPALARLLGREGEEAAQIIKNSERIPSLSGTAEYRIPDVLNRAEGVIGEVKNVESLSYTSQLRDFAAYAEQNGLRFELTVRRSTQLSGPLQEAVNRGEILLKYLPQ